MFRIFTLMAGALLLTAACTDDVREAQGFSLPEGDAARGQDVFVDMGCLACHTIDGLEQDAATAESSIKLGGQSGRVKTYGQLVTSVINPSHRISGNWHGARVLDDGKTSRMQSYNEVMTVQELVDVVTFLKSRYPIREYPRTRYYPYYPTDKETGG